MIFDKEGRQIADDDQRKIVPDGGYLRVRMNVMDGRSRAVDEIVQDGLVPKVPVGTRTLPMSDSERERRAQMRAQRDEHLTNAWKNPEPTPVEQEQAHVDSVTSDPYAARNERLANRWRDAS